MCVCVCVMIKEKEKEKESARETTIPNEGINRQIQSQRAVFSWSTKAGDPLVVFSGHEFHLREEKNSFPSKQKRVKKR